MLQQEEPDDYVLATGECYSVRQFVETAFHQIGHNIEWRGAGVEEKGVDADTGRVLIEIDPRYFRPTEVPRLEGDATKAREKLGWTRKTSFEDLVKEMLQADIRVVNQERNRRDRSA